MSAPRSLLVLNPNSSTSVTRSIELSIADLVASGEWQVECRELSSAPAGIETAADIDFVAPLVADRIKQGAYAAHVVACFSDPGVVGGQAVTRAPVLGIGACAYHAAAALVQPFGVVSILPASVERHRVALDALGLLRHLAGDLPC